MSKMFKVKVYAGGEITNHPETGCDYSEGYFVGFQMKDGAHYDNLLKMIRKKIGFDNSQIIRGLTYRCPILTNFELRYRPMYITNDRELHEVFENEKQLGYCMQFLEFYVDYVDAQIIQEEAVAVECEVRPSAPSHEDDEDDEDDVEYYTSEDDYYDDDDDDDDDDGDAGNAMQLQPYCEAICEVNEMVVNEFDIHNPYTTHEENMLQVGFLFRTKQDVIDAVKDYNIRHNKTFRVKDSSCDRWYAKCKRVETECPWKIRARRTINGWKIVTYVGPHSCMSNVLTSDQPHLDSSLIARDVEGMVKEDVTVKIKVLQEHIHSKYGYRPSYRKTWVAKDKAVQNLYGRWDESYSRLPQYFNVLQATNPGTIVEWKHLEYSEGYGANIIYTSNDIFMRVFWAFAPCIHAFKFCRPVLTVDGTFLYGKYRGTLLIASGVDADNHIVPVGFAIVESENNSSWAWFLQNIKTHVTKSRRLTIISDRHNGLVQVMNNNTVWQHGEAVHRYCTRHVAANVAKQIKNNAIQDTVKKIAGRFDSRKFNKEIEELQRSHPECVTYLSTIDVSQWTAAYDGGHRYGIMTTNVVECVNGVLKGTRHLPITAVVDDTFRKCVTYFYKRRDMYGRQISEGYACPKFVRKILEHRARKANQHAVHVFNRDIGLCSVRSGKSWSTEHTVRLKEGICTCGKFQGFHIPCSHAIAGCREFGVDHMSFVSIWYSLNHCKNAYSANFFPLGDQSYWPEYNGRLLLPNNAMVRRVLGRPRTRRYHNEMDSNPRPIICGLCGETGHNRRTCSSRIR